MSLLASLLSKWFEENQRDLPWRRLPKDPYRVWISEVMLQQTRVEAVIPYFERFMSLFPTIESLAVAEEKTLLKAWEGLGYYSRVRSLKRAAMLLVDSGQQILPDNLEALLALPGIGPYTAGAILSFAFEKKAVAIDGNVKRVVSRLFALDDPSDSKALWKEVQTHLEKDLLLGKKPFVIMEGLIELGALVCTPNPKCDLCPLKHHCKACIQGRQQYLPIAKKRVEILDITTHLAVVISKNNFGNDCYLVHPPKKKGLFSGLSRFPTAEEVFGAVRENKEIVSEKKMPKVVQTFTRYKETLYPFVYRASSLKIPYEEKNLVWIEKEQLENLTMPSGHRKIKESLLGMTKMS